MSKKESTEAIHIAPPNIKVGEVYIKGTAPLVMHKFSQKAKGYIKAKQEAGRRKGALRAPEAARGHLGGD